MTSVPLHIIVFWLNKSRYSKEREYFYTCTLMYNYIVYTCAWFDYLFYAYCLIHLSLFELGNLEYISWTVGVGTGLLCFSCKKSVAVFTMWAKTEYSVRLAMQGNLWIKSFFYLKKKKKNLNPSDSIFRIHTREKEGVSWGKEFQELCKLVQAFSCFLFVNITKYYFCSLH